MKATKAAMATKQQALEAEAKLAAEMAAAEATRTAVDAGKKERLLAVSRAREEGRKALEASRRKAKAAAAAAGDCSLPKHF